MHRIKLHDGQVQLSGLQSKLHDKEGHSAGHNTLAKYTQLERRGSMSVGQVAGASRANQAALAARSGRLRVFSPSQAMAVAAAMAGVFSVSQGTPGAAPRWVEATELQQQQHSEGLSCQSAHMQRSGCQAASK